MTAYETAKTELRKNPRRWLVTGVAGFIGSHLLETLLKLDQEVVGLDNLSTGYRQNLEEVKTLVPSEQWKRFRFIEGDIRDIETCRSACAGNEIVLHEAALGSVPRSIADPITANQCNTNGFLNVLVAARDAGVKRLVYASSSSTYGDDGNLPKAEDRIGRPLSPYAATKYVNELYAEVFAGVYQFNSIGLRYFNVFGPRQDPNGAYAAVIPRWFHAMHRRQPVEIYGDGETSRDFCYIDNCVQANILAACTGNAEALNQVYNVAFGERTSLNELFHLIRDRLGNDCEGPVYKEFRQGDVRHSLADISKAKRLLGYIPSHSVKQGLDLAAGWYVR